MDINRGPITPRLPSGGASGINPPAIYPPAIYLEDPWVGDDGTVIPGLSGPAGAPGIPGPTVLIEVEVEEPLMIPGPAGTQGLPGLVGPAMMFEQDPPDDIPVTYPPYYHYLDHNIFADSMNSTPYSNLADWFRTTRSSGRITGGVVSDGGSGKINISQMDGMIFVANSMGSKFVFFRKAAVSGITIDDSATSWIYLDYDSGNLTYRATQTRSDIHEYDQFTVGRVRRDASVLEILQSGHNLYNKERRQHDRLILKYGPMDWVNGALISQTGTDHIALTLGNWYVANTPYTTAALDTNPPGVGFAIYSLWSYINGAWVEATGQVTVPVTQYNKMTPVGSESLASLPAGKYGVYWVFLCPNGDLNLLYGQDSYTSSTAALSTVPAGLPGYFTSWAQLIGRIVFKKGTDPWYQIDSAFGTKLTLSTVSDHNSLAGLQGGALDEYYHLTLNSMNKVKAGFPVLLNDPPENLIEALPMMPPGRAPARTLPFFVAAGTSSPITLLDGPALLFFVAAGTANNIGITS